MKTPLLTSAGLLLDIIGVVMLFLYGLPRISRSAGDCLQWTPEEVRETRQKKIDQYNRRAWMALVLIVLGFALQGVAVWV